MSYEVRVSDPIADVIRRLKARIQMEVQDGLEAAGLHPGPYESILEGPHQGLPCYRFKINMPPRVHKIVCVFQYEQDEGAIYVTGLGIDDGEKIEMPGGAFIS